MFNSRISLGIQSTSSRFTFNGDSGTNELAQTAIGQGKTLVTPLQNAMVMCAIANDGVMMQPYLVDQVRNVDGGVIRETETQELAQPLEKEECDTLKTMLRKVVTSGTGTKAYSSDYTVYEKQDPQSTMMKRIPTHGLSDARRKTAKRL